MSCHNQTGSLYPERGEVDPDAAARLRAANLLEISSDADRMMRLEPGDVIWSMSADGRITHVSREVEAMRGLTPAEAMSQSLDQIHTPASQLISLTYFQTLMAALVAGERPSAFRGNLEYLCKDGSIALADVQVLPHVAADGSLIELLGISRPLR